MPRNLSNLLRLLDKDFKIVSCRYFTDKSNFFYFIYINCFKIFPRHFTICKFPHLDFKPCDCSHALVDELLEYPVQFFPHLVHILLHIVLGIVPLLLKLVLHDHLTLRKKNWTVDWTLCWKHFPSSHLHRKHTSLSTKRLSMSLANCHCGLFSMGSSRTFVFTLAFLACGGWSDFFSCLPSSADVWTNHDPWLDMWSRVCDIDKKLSLNIYLDFFSISIMK